jgi:hypothetical protein
MWQTTNSRCTRYLVTVTVEIPYNGLFMSFTFKWPRFSDQFHYDAIQMLNTALNKGNKPPIIADKIQVVELEMGSQVNLTCLIVALPSYSFSSYSLLNLK